MTTRELLKSAVRKFGPERAKQALRAFNDNPCHDYCGCALAHAYGNATEFQSWRSLPKGNLARDMSDAYSRGNHDMFAWAAAQMGLTLAEFNAVSTAHCGWRKTERDPISVFLRDLLEAEAAKMTVRAAVCA